MSDRSAYEAWRAGEGGDPELRRMNRTAWFCPYCYKQVECNSECCGECHAEEMPVCPECGSDDYEVIHVKAEDAGGAGCETTYKVCNECNTQFDHE